MNLIIPPPLKPGDKIAIVATARWITPEQLDEAKAVIASWGFEVCTGQFIHTRDFQLAGDDHQRAQDLQNAINDPNVKAIMIARGGYGTIRILDEVDFSPLLRHPKWICGYSDITVLHTKLQSLGIASIHSTMPVSFMDCTDVALNQLRGALAGELDQIDFTDVYSLKDHQMNVSGLLTGGNLSVLYSMLGSQELNYNQDIILFLEDVDEMSYHIDRMMYGLKRSGVLRRVVAVCLGGFTQMKDNTPEFGFKVNNPWGRNALEIIGDICSTLHIPLFTGFPAGHLSDNRAFYLGVQATLSTDHGLNRLVFQHRLKDK
jgi:muramoyltetrapeptide carboxypeptidase